MNDDELTRALTQAMQAATAADEPSAQLTQTLVRARVGAPRRPYLVPIGATAVVTALTAGGFVVANLQGSPTATATGDTVSPTPAATSAAAAPSSAPPSVGPTIVSQAAALSPVPSATAAASARPVTTTTTARTTTAPATSLDDSALFAGAGSYSVTEKTTTDPTLADTTTKTKTVTLVHDQSKVYAANTEELDWDDLAKLPTDTEGFRAAVTEPGSPPNAVEKGLQELLQDESPLPWPQRKAAVSVATSMPGATVTRDTHDAAGRPAVLVSVETDWLIDDYYFDPVSFRLLEASSFVTPEWEAHWTPLDKQTGQATQPLGTGYLTLYSDWTLTPKG